MEQLYFWGKIPAETSDYYIAIGVNFTGHYEFPEKNYYYAISRTIKPEVEDQPEPQEGEEVPPPPQPILAFYFYKLPETLDYHDEEFQKNYLKPLNGDPKKIIKAYKVEEEPEAQPEEGDEDKPPADPDASEDENAKKKEEPKDNFTEELKLSYMIRQIDYDTSIFPEGALRLIPEHELRVNKTFKGLKPEELKNKNKFLHFRPIRDEKKREYIETDEAIERFDILESIETDDVKGSWSIQLDPTKTICNVRSLLWPGYYAVHKANSKIFCSCYFGNGIKNADLPFMI
ncbi:MAG: hypothetical protein MJ252_25260 [archaeon]|nr:hypothetical protein [archaeon]